tara:strand:+ start:689 stop:817 length:129 start_codon:yes stop_codon:yes gene_type:complete
VKCAAAIYGTQMIKRVIKSSSLPDTIGKGQDEGLSHQQVIFI